MASTCNEQNVTVGHWSNWSWTVSQFQQIWSLNLKMMAQKIQLNSAHRGHYINPFFLTENLTSGTSHLESSSRNSLAILFQSSMVPIMQAYLNCGKTIFRSCEPKYPKSLSLSHRSHSFFPLCIISNKIKTKHLTTTKNEQVSVKKPGKVSQFTRGYFTEMLLKRWRIQEAYHNSDSHRNLWYNKRYRKKQTQLKQC